ncbi:regulatory protein GemA [Niveispirillum sp. SYP-B3756]|uniref:regulatory protein GemA n=1 Tax=Niveispirillum sp. SYP-B3756 TaxID=2662178 RepID=UPI00156517B1|nr:regulatory protein GemA [Niveispirillum sp. SYP-B3756]
MTKRPPIPAESQRARAIRAIQSRRRQIPALAEDDTWRDFIERATGLRSLRSMPVPFLAQVLDALAAAGASAGPGRSGDRQLAKLRAEWISLHEEGATLDASDGALLAWAGRQLARPVDRLDDLTSADKRRLIEGLKCWALRLEQD